MLTIVPYEPKYNQNFRDLNIAWINEYFKVEKKDRELLNDPQSSIIAKGGYIFIGLWYNKPVGCFALIKKEIDRYELGKMAVNKSHHGLKIGQYMLAYAIDVARTENWKTLALYSSTKLDAALHIYKKFGFKEVPLEDNLEYLRSDVKMELTLLNVT
ncbi:GNAT family N-acetyltransferase [uncultured Maribacter sp.]|uniref:GNAT family N-acetyltransferase n=1 Tax=uncultured Maribacter sp. TaxID=431308 RepID=UPI0026017D2A|nr:GNAT family N-acetyltransferase [uncultured Maribacter sp.]